MSTTSQTESTWMRPRNLMLLWIAYGIVFVAALGQPAVRRTQEARVLETAREMLGQPLQRYLIPELNGKVRVQKPPLAYWLSAASFRTFGVSEWAGRLPGAIAGWLTVGVTFALAQLLWNRRTAFFAAAALGGSFLFVRHMQLAETDGLATLGVTTAVYCFLRAIESRRARWWHAASAMIGLAAMSKGPPAAYPLLFLLATALVERDWRIGWRWVRCGAPITAVAVALPWWIYVKLSPVGHVISDELDDLTAGADHGKSFLAYFPQMLIDTAPWSLILPFALAAALVLARRDKLIQRVLLWSAAVFVPLCFVGNKQSHYLLPLMPPLLVIVGWAVSRGLENIEQGKAIHAVRQAMAPVVPITLLAAIGFVATPSLMVKHVRTLDIGVAIVAVAAAVGIQLLRRRGLATALAAFAVTWALGWPLLNTLWLPTLNNSDTRQIARTLDARFGDGPYCFYGDTAYLPLCFTMRQAIPVAESKDALMARLAAEPGLVVLSRARGQGPANDPAGLSPTLVNQFSIGAKEQAFDVYRAERQ